MVNIISKETVRSLCFVCHLATGEHLLCRALRLEYTLCIWIPDLLIVRPQAFKMYRRVSPPPHGVPQGCVCSFHCHCLCRCVATHTIVGVIRENNEELKLPDAMRAACASWPAKPKSWLLISGNGQEVSQHPSSSLKWRELTISNTRGYSCGISTHLPWAEKSTSAALRRSKSPHYSCTVDSILADCKGLIWKDF